MTLRRKGSDNWTAGRYSRCPISGTFSSPAPLGEFTDAWDVPVGQLRRFVKQLTLVSYRSRSHARNQCYIARPDPALRQRGISPHPCSPHLSGDARIADPVPDKLHDAPSCGGELIVVRRTVAFAMGVHGAKVSTRSGNLPYPVSQPFGRRRAGNAARQ